MGIGEGDVSGETILNGYVRLLRDSYKDQGCYDAVSMLTFNLLYISATACCRTINQQRHCSPPRGFGTRRIVPPPSSWDNGLQVQTNILEY